jgi:hypothetical protein
MLIANPIYDVVFKRLMENEKVAKFFIGTLLGEPIESIEVKPQEFTFIKELDLDDPEVQKYIKKKAQERLTINVFRLDFVATIRTELGELKKVLIEIQKAKNPIDLMRFRNYLAEQYKREDIINQKKEVLPITTIYILGFKLPEINSACIKVERNYKDLIMDVILDTKSEFVEKLTHDSFVVQVERITDRYQTRLDKLLSIFEQKYFIDERKVLKEFAHDVDIEEMKLAMDILHHAGVTPEERAKIEAEREAWRTIQAMFGEQEEELMKTLEELDEAKKALNETSQALNETSQALNETSQALTEKENENRLLKQQLEEFKRKLGGA